MNEWVFIVFGAVAVIVGILLFMYYTPKDNSSSVDKAQNLSQSKYSSNMTGFRAGMEAKASAKRGELLSNVNNEINQLTNTIRAEAEALKAGYAKDHAFTEYSMESEKKLADHESYLALADNKTTVARIASQAGLDPETMRLLILEEAKTKRELLLEETRLNKEILLEEARLKTVLTTKTHEMELDVEKSKRLKAIDLDFEHKMAMLDANMAEIQHLLPQHLLKALDEQLSKIHFEYEQVKELDEGEYREREVKRVATKMKALEKNIRERQKNLSA